MTPIDSLNDKAVVPLWPDAGRLCGLGKNATYRAAKAGEIPTVRFGAKYLVPVAPLRKLLGLEVNEAA